MQGLDEQDRVSEQAVGVAYCLIPSRHRLGRIKPTYDRRDDPRLLGGRHAGKRQRGAGGAFSECTIGRSG